MLREQHYRTAAALFGTTDFDRLFVVHALNPKVRGEVAAQLASQRIHWLTIREIVADLLPWYRAHETKAVLRNSLIGDLLHLLVGYCGLDVPDTIVK